MNMNEKSYAEIGAILKKFEIGGITDALTDGLEESYAQLPAEIIFDKTATLVSAVGGGESNYDTRSWTPSENGVYSFDMEVYFEENMYTNFLLGIAALGAGELDFKNITEDTSGVDWENGTGKRTVSFEWNEHAYTLEARVENDWFDSDVAEQLSKIISSNGNGKQLFFTSDGYQECIVFYRNADWADIFQSETGLSLSSY